MRETTAIFLRSVRESLPPSMPHLSDAASLRALTGEIPNSRYVVASSAVGPTTTPTDRSLALGHQQWARAQYRMLRVQEP